ncbi:MAG: hypothetical protein HY763_12765 [Planctomycetes bacterium]|nr:hypothetical protein [Planctomycetota bacterium]
MFLLLAAVLLPVSDYELRSLRCPDPSDQLCIASLTIPNIGRWGPTTYLSPGGDTRLTVLPDDDDERGGATYLLRRGGDECEFRAEFSLREVKISRVGTIAGIAYTGRWSTEDEIRNPPRLHVVILAPDGQVLFHEVYDRQYPGWSCNPPCLLEPVALQMVYLESAGRFIVRLEGLPDYEAEFAGFLPGEWWGAFDEATGEPLSVYRSDTSTLELPVFFLPVRGTVLLAVHGIAHWWTKAEPYWIGRIALVDPGWHTIWVRDLVDDYSPLYRTGRRLSGVSEFDRYPLFDIGVPGVFAVVLYGSGTHIAFEVSEGDAGEWEIAEVDGDRSR